MGKEKTGDLAYRIIQIQTTKFSFEDLPAEEIELLFIKKEALGLNLSNEVEILKNENLIICDIHTQLLNTQNHNALLIEHKGQTKYEVMGLQEYYDPKEDQFHFPDEFMIQLMALAYTHARALLAVEINPTAYKGYYTLPVIDPQDFIKT